MKHTSKRLLALALCVLMIMTLLPVGAFAADPVAKIGDVEYASLEAAFTAAAGATAGNPVTIEIIKAGSYEIPTKFANITLKANVAEGEVVAVPKDNLVYGQSAGSLNNVTFENLTFNLSSALYTGFQHSNNVTFKGCKLIGRLNCYGKTTFDACTFDLTALNDYIWTYGSDVDFTGCTFNTQGKAILCYNEGSGANNVSVTNCTFNATQGAKAGAIANQNCSAIEIDNYGCGVNLTTSDNNVQISDNAFSGEWRIKTYYTPTKSNTITVNGTQYTNLALDGFRMTVDANKNATVYYPVAQIGDTKYETFAAAFAAAKDENSASNPATNPTVITLLGDVTVSGTMASDSNKAMYVIEAYDNITINGNGYKFILKDIVNNSTKAGYIFTVRGPAVFNSVTVERAPGWTMNRFGGFINATNTSNVTLNNCVIDLYEANIAAVEAWGDFPVNMAENSTVTVNGGIYTGGKVKDGQPDDQKGFSVGSAGATLIFNAGETNGIHLDGEAATVSISGGTFTGDKALRIKDGLGTKVSITGGTFGVNPSAWVAKGYQAGQVSGEELWIVGKAYAPDTDITVATEQTTTVDTTEINVPKEVEKQITENTAVTGVELKDEAIGNIVEENKDKLAEGGTVEIEVEVKAVPQTFVNDEGDTNKNIVKFDLVPVATVKVNDVVVEENLTVSNEMIDTTKSITVKLFTGFKPVQIIHNGEGGFVEIFNETGDKKFDYDEATKTCTLTIDHFSSLTAVSKACVAQIGETPYVTLEEALAAAANSGDTIKLLNNIDAAAQINVQEKNITLDMNGKTIKYTGGSNLSSGVIVVHNGAALTVTGNGTINSGDKAYAAIALTKSGDSSESPAKLTVENGTFIGKYYAIVGNGSRDNTEVVINDGTFRSIEGLAIYHPQSGKLTINNGTFTGLESAIEMRAGTLVINDGNFTATAEEFSCNPNGSGTTVIGAAVALSQHSTNKELKAIIKGGEFNGVKAFYEVDLEDENVSGISATITGGTFKGAVESENVTNFISGGSFSKAPEADAAIVGQCFWKNADGTFSLMPHKLGTGVVEGGEVYYYCTNKGCDYCESYEISKAPCDQKEAVAPQNGSFELVINGKSQGFVNVTKSGSGYTISGVPEGEFGNVWQYADGHFYQSKTEKISRGFFLWNILFGRKEITTTYYLSVDGSGKYVTNNTGAQFAAATLYKHTYRNGHDFSGYTALGNGTHVHSCKYCGKADGSPAAPCDFVNGVCQFCGTQDPKTTGYINVKVDMHKTGFLFFKLYMADISVSSDIVGIKKVEYSVGTGGLKYTTGLKVMSTRPIYDIIIVVTATDGAHGFHYNASTGTITPYPLMK